MTPFCDQTGRTAGAGPEAIDRQDSAALKGCHGASQLFVLLNVERAAKSSTFPIGRVHEQRTGPVVAVDALLPWQVLDHHAMQAPLRALRPFPDEQVDRLDDQRTFAVNLQSYLIAAPKNPW
jgi:hypothetical protein